MRDFRATRTQRLVSEIRFIRFTLPDLIAGIALFAFVLLLVPILTTIL